jgi:hypothetical protein
MFLSRVAAIRLAVALAGSFIARFQPRGLALTSLALALALTAIGVVALTLPNTAGPAQIVGLHATLVALFAGASLLFRRAARGVGPRRPGKRA